MNLAFFASLFFDRALTFFNNLSCSSKFYFVTNSGIQHIIICYIFTFSVNGCCMFAIICSIDFTDFLT